MAAITTSIKHLQISKANTMVVSMVSLAAFMATFTLFSSRALLSQHAYQGRVIKEKTTARNQLDANIKEAEPLSESYRQFIEQSNNVLGGSSTGLGNLDGDNAKIVLDALPSKYDFPALVTSLEKLLTSPKFSITSITGQDDELAQKVGAGKGLVEIPYEIGVKGNYDGMKEAISLLERSIRPFQVDNLSLAGGDKEMTMTIKGKTYYQPERSLNITTKEVK